MKFIKYTTRAEEINEPIKFNIYRYANLKETAENLSKLLKQDLVLCYKNKNKNDHVFSNFRILITK